MGIKIELSAQNRDPLAPGEWEATLVKFEHGKSGNKKTPFVQPVFKVTDEDAVRVVKTDDGEYETSEEPFKGNLWGDNFWLTPGALFRLKEFLEQLGSELPGEGEEVESEVEYAEMLNDMVGGTDLTVLTELEEFEHKGEDRVKAVVAEVRV